MSLSFLLVTDAVFRAEGSVEQTILCVQLWYFFSSYKLQLQLLLLFGHVMLLCLILSLFSWVRDLCCYQTVWSTRPRYATPTYPFALFLQRRISAGTKFHPSPPPRRSHRGGGRELAQDPKQQCEWGFCDLLQGWHLPLFLSLFNITLKMCLKEPEFGKVQIDLTWICTL